MPGQQRPSWSLRQEPAMGPARMARLAEAKEGFEAMLLKTMGLPGHQAGA